MSIENTNPVGTLALTTALGAGAGVAAGKLKATKYLKGLNMHGLTKDQYVSSRVEAKSDAVKEYFKSEAQIAKAVNKIKDAAAEFYDDVMAHIKNSKAKWVAALGAAGLGVGVIINALKKNAAKNAEEPVFIEVKEPTQLTQAAE